MGEDHPSTTVPLELKLVEGLAEVWSATGGAQGAACVPLGDVLGEQLEVGVPLVADDFSARETAHWNDLQSVSGWKASEGVLGDGPWLGGWQTRGDGTADRGAGSQIRKAVAGHLFLRSVASVSPTTCSGFPPVAFPCKSTSVICLPPIQKITNTLITTAFVTSQDGSRPHGHIRHPSNDFPHS